MIEIWKPIKGYECLYEISNLGKIKSLKKRVKSRNGFAIKKCKIIKQYLHKSGYYYFRPIKNNKYKNLLIHRCIAEAFIPNPENKPQVNHKNGIKIDNSIDNLEWVTASENSLHAFKIGLRKVNKTMINRKGKISPILEL